MPSRRMFMAQSAATAGMAMVPGLSLAKITLGDTASVTTVSDGFLTLPGSFIFGPMPQDELPPILDRHGLSADSLTPECNVTVFRDGTNTVLFDVGSGPDFMPTAGELLDHLEAAGITPEDVTHVVFTHAHPDHIWGLLDDFDEPVFADATYMMGRAEWDYWWNPETVNTIGEDRAAFAVGAKRRMEMIEDVVQLFDDGNEILPGIAARATYGHTPGHMAFEIRSGGEAVMVLGDSIVNHHVAFERPDWPSGSDQDTDQAATTRRMLLDQLATDRIRIIGFHLPNGGIGRVERAGSNFRFVGEAE